MAWQCVSHEQPARLQLHESELPAHFSAEVKAAARKKLHTMKAHMVSLDINLECTPQWNTKARFCAGPVEVPTLSHASSVSRLLDCAVRWYATQTTAHSLEQFRQLSAEGSPRMTAWGRRVRPDSGVPNLIWTVHTLSRISTEGVEDFGPLDRRWYSSGVASGLRSLHEWREEKPASRRADRIEGSAEGTANQGNGQSVPTRNAIRLPSRVQRGGLNSLPLAKRSGTVDD